MKLNSQCICKNSEKFIPKKIQNGLCECIQSKSFDIIKIPLILCSCSVKDSIQHSKFKIEQISKNCYESMIDEIVSVKLCNPKPKCSF